jgi:protease IV
LFLVSFSFSKIVKVADASDKIAVIPVTGVITVGGDSAAFSPTGASSTSIVKFIEEAGKEESIKGIVLEINSPGGSAVASKEIADAVKKSEKPVVAWIREVGASGGYWVASAADEVVADPLSITGSIGAIGSYLEFSGLFEEYGIGYERLVSGKYKDTGVPYRELNEDERRLFQSKLDMIHDVFIEEVAKNRELEISEVRKVATGEFYLGKEAFELELIDYLGNKDTAVSLIEKMAGIKDVKLVRYEKKMTLLDFFGGLSVKGFYLVGQGIGDSFRVESSLPRLE